MNISLPDISMMIDASLDGWCGVLLPRKAIGVCSPDVLHISMNWTELMTVVYLQRFRSTLRGKTVRVLSDNATAVCCLKRHGSLKSATTFPHNVDSQVLRSRQDHIGFESSERSDECSGGPGFESEPVRQNGLGAELLYFILAVSITGL